MNTDPFASPKADVDPGYGQQIGAMADFFDRYLKADEQARSVDRPIRGAERRRLAHVAELAASGRASPSASTPPLAANWANEPPQHDGADAYRVDFTAGSGPLSRHQSPVDLSKTAYPDRAVADRKLLSYTSAPLASDMVVAGDPEADLTVASTATDGMVIVYLEDVLPSGRVVYLTEGVLRLADRKLASAPIGADPLHSYLRGDAAPMTPGKAEPIRIALSPIAAVLRKGERVRIAIAGADADNLQRHSVSGFSDTDARARPGGAIVHRNTGQYEVKGSALAERASHAQRRRRRPGTRAG